MSTALTILKESLYFYDFGIAQLTTKSKDLFARLLSRWHIGTDPRDGPRLRSLTVTQKCSGFLKKIPCKSSIYKGNLLKTINAEGGI